MSLIYLVYIPTFTGIVIMAVLVASQNYRSIINRRYLLFSLFMLVYLTCTFISDHYHGDPRSLFWIHGAIAAADVLPGVFFWFAAAITVAKLPRWLYWVMTVVPAVMVPLAFSSQTVSSVSQLYYGTAIGSAHWLYTVQLIYLVVAFGVGLAVMERRARAVTGSERMQLRLVMSGLGIAVVANLVTNVGLPLLGETKYGVLIGTPTNLVLVLCIGYAIIRHRLFDIKAVVLRSVTYLFSIAVVVLVYSFVAFELGDKLVLKTQLTIVDRVFYVGLAVALALSFRPLITFFRHLTDRLFYRDRYDPQGLVNGISRILASEIQLDAISQQVVEQLQKQMRVRNATIIVMSNGYFYYATDPKVYAQARQLLPELRLLGERVRLVDRERPGQAHKIMSSHGIAAFVPLISNHRLSGYLLVSGKLSGYIFSGIDYETLDTISSALAVTIENALSYSTIQHFNEILQDRVSKATSELQSANAKLQQLDRAKDEFISMASHQLRTPISVLAGYITLLIDRVYGEVPPQFEQTLHKALTSAEHMGALVNDLLNVSRMDTGRFYLVREAVDLNKIVGEEVEQLEIKATAKHVTLQYQRPAHPVPVLQLDEEKIRQAVTNLIDNAIAYSPNGQVTVQLSSDGQTLEYRVTDNGIGVPREQRAHLFSRFFRADNAKEVRPDGTGLGLYLVRRVVEDHGGEVWFDGDQPHGSVFGFRLPIKTLQSKQEPTREPSLQNASQT